jgi:hypothetical protein
MDRDDTAVSRHEFEPGTSAASADLDTMVAEIGATYPMMAYTGHLEEDDGVSMLDSMILAGLVTP